MKIGFTGTRRGMTDAQRATVSRLLSPSVTEVHHGDCRGADADFHHLCRDLSIPIVGHPPTNPKLRAFCDCDVLLPAKPYLARDRDIVNATELLIATPAETQGRRGRGGTWFTVGYAEQVAHPLIVIWPDGTIDG